jgi:exonuclease SbcC
VALQKGVNEIQQLIDAKTGQVSAQRETLQGLEQGSAVLQSEIDVLVQTSEYESLEQVTQVLGLQLNKEEERTKIDAYNQALHTAKASVTALQKTIGNEPFSAETFAQSQARLEQQQKLADVHHDTLVKEAQSFTQLRVNWEKHQELTKDLEKLRLRESNLATLGSLFQNEGFLDYIASVYLQNLCHAANARFRSLTRQRLVLEIDDDNEFRVIDALNGGKVRSVKTLSGGQLFQASLSLALALSESIQASAGAEQNFFFLDEGFGTQDKESLRLVFESLKELRKENRVVGLISHVDELQEEIDVCLKVRNDEEVGSLVELVG